MSAETIAAIHTAVQAHLTDVDVPDAILTDWFIGYASMHHDPETDDGIMHGIAYATSDGSPQGAYGVGSLMLTALRNDLTVDDGD